MAIKLYECNRCRFTFPAESGEEGLAAGTTTAAPKAAAVKCPRCGSAGAKMLPYNAKMVLDALAMYRARSGGGG